MTEPNLTTSPEPDSPDYLDPEALLAKVAERDFCDFPTGWAIQAAGLTHADPRCSAVQTDGAFLCDCGAVLARWAQLRKQIRTGS